MSEGLRDKITAAIDRQQAEAEDLDSECPSPWRTEWDGQDYRLLDADGDEITSATYVIATWEPDATLDRANCNTKHINWMRDHDPAAVLRRCAADRKLLAWHDLDDEPCDSSDCAVLEILAEAWGVKA